jgi:hypothetical protein
MVLPSVRDAPFPLSKPPITPATLECFSSNCILSGICRQPSNTSPTSRLVLCQQKRGLEWKREARCGVVRLAPKSKNSSEKGDKQSAANRSCCTHFVKVSTRPGSLPNFRLVHPNYNSTTRQRHLLAPPRQAHPRSSFIIIQRLIIASSVPLQHLPDFLVTSIYSIATAPRITDNIIIDDNNGWRKGKVFWWQELGRQDIGRRWSQEAAESLGPRWSAGKPTSTCFLFLFLFLCEFYSSWSRRIARVDIATSKHPSTRRVTLLDSN